MSVAAHVQELQKKHEVLSRQVETAQRHPSTSDAELAAMKKQKLRLKEEIHRLSPT